MILSGQSIRARGIFAPFNERTTFEGMTFGLGPAGYDVRLAETVTVYPNEFVLGSTIEHFTMPDDLLAMVADKSTLARQGICVQNTVIEPGWKGFLTIEITNHHNHRPKTLNAGTPIAQIIFHVLDYPAERPYTGKYQDQTSGPQAARFDR